MWRSYVSLALTLALALTIATGSIWAQEKSNSLPEGHGLSAKYPGDRGIARDAAVLLAEDFELGDVADLEKTWHSVSNKDQQVISFREDAPVAGVGQRSLQMTGNPAQNEGGHLYKKLPREVDTAFARFYVKFPEEAGYVHHFVQLGGFRPATTWPQGGAGQRPRGDERMTVGIEPTGDSGRLPAPGAWNFYLYWHEMKASVGNRYWGNSIAPAKPLLVPRDQWQCVELMMKCNQPGERDGELALWLDGKLAMHVHRGTPRDAWTGMGFRLADEKGGEPFEGFSWRTSDKLKINFFWLLHYVTDTNQRRNKEDVAQDVTVWFDNIVISEKYVGPIKLAE
jgi:hypothetical protein